MTTPPNGPQPWDGYLVGDENALAHAGASAMARGEIAGVSPMILHGPSGVGKTRLLEGLVADRLARQPGASVAMVTGEAFAIACGEAMGRPEGWGEVRDRFRNVDLLALDGLESVGRVPPALEELAHTLDALDARGSAVAIASRTAPGQWVGWPGRLTSRLLGGLAIRVDPPSPSTRRRYLMDRARGRSIAIAAEAIDAMAAEADGYRTIDGWLARLVLAGRVEHRPIDSGLVAAYLDDEAAPAADAPTIESIARAVASRFGVKLRDLRGAARQPQYVEPRHLAIYLSRTLGGASLRAAGAYFGKRDPATIRHACKATAARLASDPALASTFEALAAALRPGRG